MDRVQAARSRIIELESWLLLGLERRQELYSYKVSVVKTMLTTAATIAIVIDTAIICCY